MLCGVDGQLEMIDGVADMVVVVETYNGGCIGAGIVFHPIARPDCAVASGDFVSQFDFVANGQIQSVDAVALVVDLVDCCIEIGSRGAIDMSAPSHSTAVDDGLSRSETIVIDR